MSFLKSHGANRGPDIDGFRKNLSQPGSMLMATGKQTAVPTISRSVKLIALASTVGILCACASSILSPTTNLVGDDHIVVPGERVGPIRLGMSEPELLQLGRPEGPEPVPLAVISPYDSGQAQTVPGIRYKFGGKMIWVYLERATRRVVRIDLGYRGDCGSYHTEESVSCGSSKVYNVIGAFGTPDKESTWDFGNHQVMRLTYYNGHHSPRSLTIFNFHPGRTMDIAPVDDLQDISLYEGDYR
jgi:hypothetical protein